MTILLDLAAKVEALTGACRELDAEIAIAVFVTQYTDDDMVFARKRERDGSDATHPGHYFIKSRSGAQAVSAPAFTSSLDAAMTLVPEGWCWMAGHRDFPKSRAYVNNGELHMSGKSQWFEVVAATPALALTAATLHARAAISGVSDNE